MKTTIELSKKLSTPTMKIKNFKIRSISSKSTTTKYSHRLLMAKLSKEWIKILLRSKINL